MKMTRLQFTLAVKTNLINKCRNMGYVCFVRYHNSVLFENNIVLKKMLMDISYGWILRKSANFHCQS